MFNKFQVFFEGVVRRVENNPTPFSRYLFLFLAILSLRLSLEFFSSRRLFTLDDLLHIGLWFTFIVLSFILQLSLFSGEKIQKVAKLSIVFFSLALTAPIIDLIVTKGVGAKMNYLSLSSLKDVCWSYISIGGSSLSRGATPGIRIEIGLMLLACFNYVRTKKSSLAMALLAALSIYTILFLSGAVPLLLGLMVDALNLQYGQDDQSTVLLLLTLDLCLLFAALYLHGKQFVRQLFRSVPWEAFTLSFLCFVLGAILFSKNYPDNFTLSPSTVFWFPLLFLQAICFAVYAGILRLHFNAQQRGVISSKLSWIPVMLIFLIGSMLSVKILFASALLWGLLFLLCEKPLQLAEVPMVRNVLQAAVFLSAAMLGFCAFNAPLIGFPANWLWIILLGGFLSGLAKEFIPSHEGFFVALQAISQWPRVVFRWLSAGMLLLYFGLLCFFLDAEPLSALSLFLFYLPVLSAPFWGKQDRAWYMGLFVPILLRLIWYA